MSIKFAVRPFSTFILAASLFAISPSLQAQSADPSAPQPQNPPANAEQKNSTTSKGNQTPGGSDQSSQESNGKTGTSKTGTSTGTSNDRLFLALPNFLTLENGVNVPPLTSKQKFQVVARGSFDKVQFGWYALLSGISQAENSEPGYGQGWEGYGKRYGSAFADGTLENFMTSAVLPSLLHQDPRFYQSGQGSFAHRTGYAIHRIFVTKTDSGNSQFNYSEIVGSALSAAISTNTYHPRAFITTRFDPATNMLTYVHNESDRTLSNTLSVWGTQVGYDTVTLVIKEFWPDIHRKMAHKQRADPDKPVSNP